ncbi:RidA family protein [Desulfovibrio litoralis]|uniref:2-iminobutanoate/2-iminopropanoate deaminase n=1 Tax=Desulfovibrio litoralis DSM 11393 TaxID=1121455 RepID=A0A1M7T6S9_9BACT|nr:RidA family protein [Desulfovibrio litoralis]SHN66443.1 2-iminobutanoate/2-iminopropanoate deaminase [Desulfovibrio litoralis DSM 11393]
MKKVIESKAAPAAVGPYSQAILANGILFASGQLPLNAQTGKLEEGDISAKATRCLENVKAILEEAGLGFSDVVKVTVYLTDMSDFAAVNAVYAKYFSAPYPARSCVAVAALPLGGTVEIEVTAATKCC